jgi:hypothetical protein
LDKSICWQKLATYKNLSQLAIGQIGDRRGGVVPESASRNKRRQGKIGKDERKDLE